MSFFGPLITFDVISADDLNASLTAWGHRDGALRRPATFGSWSYGLREHGRLVGVCSASTLIRPTCAGGLTRGEAVELSRICAERRDLCRVVLRLWRAFAFPALCRAHGFTWAISYQDRRRHSGALYRFDGWVPLAGVTESRPKVGWGWCDEEAERARRRVAVAPRREAAA